MVTSVNCAGKCLCIIISYNTTVMFQAMGKKKKSMLEGQQSLHFILFRIALLFIY